MNVPCLVARPKQRMQILTKPFRDCCSGSSCQAKQTFRAAMFKFNCVAVVVFWEYFCGFDISHYYYCACCCCCNAAAVPAKKNGRNKCMTFCIICHQLKREGWLPFAIFSPSLSSALFSCYVFSPNVSR